MSNFSDKNIRRAITKDFADSAHQLEQYMAKSTSGFSGSFPTVGRRTWKLFMSLKRLNINPKLIRLGFYVKYASAALYKKGNRLRGWIGENGRFRQFWASRFRR